MSNPVQAPTRLGCPVSGSTWSERPVNVPRGFEEDEALIEQETSTFIRKVDSKSPITLNNVKDWLKDLLAFVKDINIIVNRYRESVTKAASYKKKYRDTKGIFKNNCL